MTTLPQPEVKRVGETGQVSVGKSLAGKLVRVEPSAEGVFLRFVVDVAEKDAWWTQEPHKSQLREALAWAAKNPPAETNLSELFARALSKSGTTSRPAKRRTKRAAPAAAFKKSKKK